MNITRAALISLLVIIAAGCRRTDNLVGIQDQLLEKQLVGMWGYPGHSISFGADHTFIWTSIITGAFLDTIPDTLTMIGKYQITDGILHYSEINFTDVHLHNIITAISWVPFEEKVTIADTMLSLQAVTTFVPTENNFGRLYGTWKHEGWTCSYSTDPNRGYSNAKFEEYFTFREDTTIIHYREKYLSGPDAPKEYTYDIKEYSFHDSKLSIPSRGIRDYQVLFQNNVMLWITSGQPAEYIRNGAPVSPSIRQRDVVTLDSMRFFFR